MILPAIEEMLTIEPPRPPSTSSRPNTFDIRNEPVRLTSMIVRHRSGSRSTTGWRSSPLLAPALLTTMSTRPNASITCRRQRLDGAEIGHVGHRRQGPPAGSARTSSATDSMSRHPAAFSSSG